jgi:hypothetical protein
MAVSRATPEYLTWSELPITFNRSDHLDFIPKPDQYHLIFSPINEDSHCQGRQAQPSPCRWGMLLEHHVLEDLRLDGAFQINIVYELDSLP